MSGVDINHDASRMASCIAAQTAERSERFRGMTLRRGFTLLELMVVLLILGLLGSIAVPRVARYLSKAKVETAKVQVDALGAAIESFQLDTGRYPTSEEGLDALMAAPNGVVDWGGPYLKKRSSLIDPWGNRYEFKAPGAHGDFDLYSFGADGREGGEGDAGDLGNW
jgi:general secretion pathway protein G